MTAEPPQSPVTEGVRSLEVRWIFPGQLEAAVAGWFGRFPAGTESREDTYLLDPRWRGLSVKVRGGGALEVKAYRGSPGILEVAGTRPRAPGVLAEVVLSLQPAPPGRRAARPAGRRSARGGASAGSHWPAGRSWRAPQGRAASRGARWNSPRSAPVARTGGPWASRRPAPPDLLRSALEATAALVFAQALPGGVEPGPDDSRSYAEWLGQWPGRKNDA